ncbi:hypothetical protein J6590_081553 [Homalodisca vitripennis]|nr:hypothetical protein J6590_081553 [Homalodisca vitripennis]
MTYASAETSSHQLSPTPDRASSAGLSTPSEPCTGTVRGRDRSDRTARFQTVLPHLQLKRGAGTEDSCACQGLPAWTTTEDIADELRDLGFTPTHVAPLQRRDQAGRHQTDSFYIRFRKTGSWTRIWQLTQLLGVRVTVSQFAPRQGMPPTSTLRQVWRRP